MVSTEWRERIEGILLGILFGLIALAFIGTLTGCKTATPCAPCPPPPEAEVIRDQVRSCPDPGRLPPMVLPTVVAFPVGGSVVIIRDWLADFGDTVKARERIMMDRIESLERILDQYRDPPG